MIFLDRTGSQISHARKLTVLAGAVFFVALSASSGAMAQVTGNCTLASFTGPPNPPGPGTNLLGQIASSTAAQISAETGNASTSFQAGQGSAFVSAPGNPPPNSPGGGVWIRATGGENTTTSTSTTQTVNVAPAAPDLLNQTSTVNCNNKIRDSYSGFQIGADTARLNWNGWNFHLGTMAGYIESNSHSLNDNFNSNFQIPSVGTYVVATYGRFFADALLKQDYFNISLNNAGLGFFNQPISGRGTSFAANVGYNFALANNWFIEPSAGFVYSKTSFDSFTSAGAPGGVGVPGAFISGTQQVNDVTSEIGRASLRVGTSYQYGNLSLQPFFTASVYHEFAGNVTSSFFTSPNANFFGPVPALGGINVPATFASNTSTSRIGTYGQFSLGIAGQIANTGWLGFVRGDYRTGDNIEGYAGTAGLRYQFTPDMIAPRMPTKAMPRVMYTDVNWTGFYIGAHGGAGYDRDRIGFVGSTESANTHFAGVLGGGQIGYNYQLANKFVLGLEGDVSWADLKGGQTCGAANGLSAVGVPTGAFDPFFQTCNTQMSWLATATGKLGYSWDRTLYYLKGGVAFTDETVTLNCIVGPLNGAGSRQCNSPLNGGGPIFNTLSTSASRTGWTAGFGAEFALNANWSAKAEYDYISFGSRTGQRATARSSPPGPTFR